MRRVIHQTMIRKNRFGGELTTSLCGRLRTLADGMNLSDDASEINCMFCVREAAQRKLRAKNEAKQK